MAECYLAFKILRGPPWQPVLIHGEELIKLNNCDRDVTNREALSQLYEQLEEFVRNGQLRIPLPSIEDLTTTVLDADRRLVSGVQAGSHALHLTDEPLRRTLYTLNPMNAHALARSSVITVYLNNNLFGGRRKKRTRRHKRTRRY